MQIAYERPLLRPQLARRRYFVVDSGPGWYHLWFIGALFQLSERAAGEATKFGRGGVEFLGVIGATRFKCAEPAAESDELIRRQFSDSFGDLFDFHAAAV